MKKSLVFTLVIIMSVACSKNNGNSGSSEKEIIRTNTEEVKKSTSSTNKQTLIIAEDSRNESFDSLSESDQAIGEKIQAAESFFKNQGYQLSKISDKSDAYEKEALLFEATTEFTRRLETIFRDINVRKMSPTKMGRRHTSEQAFYALAYAIDTNANPKAQSFYSIVKQALIKDLNGEELTDYEAVLVTGQNKKMMIELIKARVDILSALGIRNLVDRDNMTLGQKMKGLLFKITGGALGSIDLPETFTKSNNTTVDQTVLLLESAVEAKNFLRELAIEKHLEKILRSAFGNIDLKGDVKDQAQETTGPTEKDLQLEEHRINIRHLIDALLQ